MKVAVCIKRVPDTASRIRIAADGRGIDRSDLQYIISPYDEFAIEEGIRRREAAGSGSVTVLTVGPEAALETLRKALGMGADDAILVRSDADLGPLRTAHALAAALRGREDDLVLFGRQSVDAQTSQVGAQTAHLLGLPYVGDVIALEIEGRTARITREVEGGHEILRGELPLAIGAQKGLNEPRYPSLKGIMAAKKKPVATVDAQTGPSQLEIAGYAPPPARPAGRIVGEGPAAAAELVRVLRDEAKVL
jgi:electron transfer flavoprotein beta subunit